MHFGCYACSKVHTGSPYLTVAEDSEGQALPGTQERLGFRWL